MPNKTRPSHFHDIKVGSPFAPNVRDANGKSTRCVLSGALFPECFGVAATLVQHQVRDLALLVLEELNFCVDNFWKNHQLRISKNRHVSWFVARRSIQMSLAPAYAAPSISDSTKQDFRPTLLTGRSGSTSACRRR